MLLCIPQQYLSEYNSDTVRYSSGKSAPAFVSYVEIIYADMQSLNKGSKQRNEKNSYEIRV